MNHQNVQQVKINLPLLHVIKQLPAYAKVIKDLCTMKQKHHVKETAFLTRKRLIIDLLVARINCKIKPKHYIDGVTQSEEVTLVEPVYHR